MEVLEQRHPRAIDLGLERCGEVYRRLGAPRPGKRCVIVAGTNGKGSTVAWLEALLAGSGRSTAAYTSPHVRRFSERLRLDGQTLEDADWVAAFAAVERARGDISLTYFEFTTLAAFWLAARAGPQTALLEVGLGGRLDTVNLVDGDLFVITPIGLDHQQWLGPDRESIGAEKAGVLRAGRPLVLSESQPPASVLSIADELACETALAGKDYRLDRGGPGLEFSFGSLRLVWPADRVPRMLALDGAHQMQNLGAALAAAALLEPRWIRDGDAVAEALAGTRLAGRLQKHPRDSRLRLDVGHNELAAVAIAEWLRGEDRQPARAVLGMYADKDTEAVVAALDGTIDCWHCAGLAGPRGQDGETLAARVRSAAGRRGRALAHDRVAAALDAALAGAADNQPVLVFGSFATVAQALEHLDAPDGS